MHRFRPFRLLLLLSLLAPLLSGCAAFRPMHGVPARYLPEEFRAASRSGKRTINLKLLGQTPPPAHRVDAGDLLSIYIEGVLGKRDEQPPVYFPLDQDVAPTVGYPLPVRDDGTVSLPLVGAVPVRGLTLIDVEERIRYAYTIRQQLLQPGRDRIFVALQRPRSMRVLVIRQEQAGGGDLGTAQVGMLTVGALKRGTGKAVTLPIYKNDVLHALAETGGLPGLDAENAIYVIRNGRHGGPLALSAPRSLNAPTWQDGGERVVIRAQAPNWGPVHEPSVNPHGDYRRQPGVAGPPAGPNGPLFPPSISIPPAAPANPAWSQPAPRPVDPQGLAPYPPAAPAPGNPYPPAMPYGSPMPYGPGAGEGTPVPASPLPSGPVTPGIDPGLMPPAQLPPGSLPVGPQPGLPPGALLPPTPLAPGPVAAPPVMPGPQPMGPGLLPAAPVIPPPAYNAPAAMPESWGHDPMLAGIDSLDGRQIIRIPVRLGPGENADIRPEDVILNDGDIVFIESRDTEVFYTGGLLGGGQYSLPRDYDLNILGAIAIAQGQRAGGGGGSRATSSVGGQSALNNDVSISASNAIVLRQLPDGTQLPIKVDLYQALRDPAEQLIIQPGDYILLQYTKCEAFGAFIERHLLEGALFSVAGAQLVGGGN